MRKQPPLRLETGRCQPEDYIRTRPGDMHGLFEIIGPLGIWMRAISSGPDATYHWEHVSVSVKAQRCPTWEEMCFIKDMFWNEDECVMQLHPPIQNYVNEHKYCLHLWKPMDRDIPQPPSILVGST